MKTKDLIDQIADLPVEERVLIADAVLRSLNPVDSVLESKWAAVAQNRLSQFRLGEVKAVPGQQILREIQQRFGR